tara:strand:+ start:274 stop:1227 length:954 start_codon:yes stop_codon:yes gene_type:complete
MLKQLKDKIINAGGFINAHAHFDRAYTVHNFSKAERKMHLHEKWKLNDKFKKSASIECYKKNIENAVIQQLKFGTTAACTFVDIDNITHGAAFCAAKQIKDDYKNKFDLKIACQTIKGVIEKEQQYLLDIWSQELDIIGSLPAADKDIEKHLDIIMDCAKRRNKTIHVHVDQLNHPSEKETELLARKTIEWGLEGKVTAVHSLSLACHPIKYRNEVYKISQDAGLSFITCPSAWIDHPRREDLVPSHNAVTPVDELLQHNLIVGIGSDNIHDVYKPYADGDMMFELRLLLESCKIYNEDELIKIATLNGKKIINIIN